MSERIPVRQGTNRSASLFNILIGLISVLILIVLALIGRQIMSGPAAAPRTAAERDIARYQEMIKASPTDPAAYAGMGAAYMEIGAYSQAVSYISKAIKLKPTEARYHVALAAAYVGQGDTGSALKSVAKAEKLSPGYEESWFQEGKIYFDRQQYSQAIAPLTKGLEIDASPSDIHYMLGQAYEKTNQADAAMAQYREAVKYMPDYPEALAALARLQKQNGKK